MRKRLVLGTIAIIVAVLTALVPPVVILLRRTAERELQVRLSSQAADVSTAIADDVLSGRAPTAEQVARIVSSSDYLVVLDSDGTEFIRYGTASASSVTGTADGPGGTRVRISTSDDALSKRVRGPLLALAAFAAMSIALGALLAALIARRLTRPLDVLAHSAARLGAGDFSAALPPASGFAEIDAIGAALGASAARLDQMLTAERSFTGDATHQLRTGLAGIGLRLELLASNRDPDVRADAEQAQAQLDRLTHTLDELLALARGGAGEQRADVDVRTLVAGHCTDWRARAQRRRRPVELSGVSPVWRVTPGLVGQIVDVLLDNAVQHGRGAISVQLEERSLTVRDGGSIPDAMRDHLFDGPADASGAGAVEPHGRGLALARRLARADGGSLELVGADPTTFRLTYPPLTG